MVLPQPNTPTAAHTPPDYDVAILGGAFSGAALGILLKRNRPATRVLILEKSTAFDRKIGESTSEVAGCFLSKVLSLSNHLSSEHYQKHGLRLWFNDAANTRPCQCTEIGPVSQARLPTFQLDRSKLDQHLLELAAAEGCTVIRPANVKEFTLGGAGNNSVTFKHGEQTTTVRAGWIADCSGRAALIARQRDTLRKLEAHPVHSMWVRFRNVNDLDSHQSRTSIPGSRCDTFTSRTSSTNHLMGRGWWSWIIPLSNGEFSAGITWDERLFSPPPEGNIGQRVKQHLLTHPIGRLMFEHAEPVENDARAYKHLPYYSTETTGDGWILCGDAAGFMDPLYSQGLDYCSHAVYTAGKILLKALDGHCVKSDLATHANNYRESYFRWFHAIYQDKYEYIGDADLMNAAFLLDIGAYFVGPVQLVYRDLDGEFAKMPYNGPVGAGFAKFMALYNRRLVAIARKRLAKGTYGRNNLGQRFMVRVQFQPNVRALRHMLKGTAIWLRLELENIF